MPGFEAWCAAYREDNPDAKCDYKSVTEWRKKNPERLKVEKPKEIKEELQEVEKERKLGRVKKTIKKEKIKEFLRQAIYKKRSEKIRKERLRELAEREKRFREAGLQKTYGSKSGWEYSHFGTLSRKQVYEIVEKGFEGDSLLEMNLNQVRKTTSDEGNVLRIPFPFVLVKVTNPETKEREAKEKQERLEKIRAKKAAKEKARGKSDE